MIQSILNGHYNFKGTIKNLLRTNSSIKITKVITDDHFGDIHIYTALAVLKYHGQLIKLEISKSMTDDILYIKNVGGKHSYEG